jgi:uncharacterized protein (DUF849 family)
MNHHVIVTCALTGAGDTVGKNPHVPVTPKQIAAAAVEAANAGATVVHCHVRDPADRQGQPRPGVVPRGDGAHQGLGRGRHRQPHGRDGRRPGHRPGENPTAFGPNTDLVGPLTRLVHVEELLPDICTLDCGTLNFGDGDLIYVSTPAALRAPVRNASPNWASRPSSRSLTPATCGSPTR